MFVFEGRQFDKEGNFQDWWSEDIINNFKKQTQCIVNQYGKFEVAGLHVRNQELHFITKMCYNVVIFDL